MRSNPLLPLNISEGPTTIHWNHHNNTPPSRKVSQSPIASQFYHQSIHKNPLLFRSISQKPTTTPNHHEINHSNPLLPKKGQEDQQPITATIRTSTMPTSTQEKLKTTRSYPLPPLNHRKVQNATQKNLKTSHQHPLPSSNYSKPPTTTQKNVKMTANDPQPPSSYSY